MGLESCLGIIGNLYWELKELSMWNSESDFYEMLGMDEKTVSSYARNTGRKTMYYDYFSPNVYEVFIDDLESNLRKRMIKDKINISKYNKKLINITKRKLLYCNKSFTNISKRELIESGKLDEACISYSKSDLELLRSYYYIYESHGDFVRNLYLMLYLAITKNLPKELLYGVTYELQLHEFSEKVTKLYGTTSEPATRAILCLADQKNIIAKYEKAEFYYYGNRRNIPQNIPKAYGLYKEVAGLDVHSDLPQERNTNSIHPLALWTLGYILFNYRRDKSELKKCAPIKEIDGWLESKGRLFVIEKAIKYAKFTLDLIECAPSANILGRIALLTDNDLPGIDDLKLTESLLSAEEYFKYAADKGYVYSINNIALLECNKIFTDEVNAKKHLNNYLLYMKSSASQYESWACTELGNFYRTGEIVRWKDDFSERTKENKVFKSISSEKALFYYRKASEINLDISSGWSCYNIIMYFSDFVKSEGKLYEYVVKIADLGEEKIIKRTKNILPKIYGLEYEDILKCR